MKISLSKRVLAVMCVVALGMAAFNTYLIFTLNNALQNAAYDSAFDYVVFQDSGIFKAKNQLTGSVDITSDNASQVLTQALSKGTAVLIKPGNYTLSSDVLALNKEHMQISGDGAWIIGNGKMLILKGDAYTFSQNNMISGLTIVNGTLRIENSFGTTVSNLKFEDCSVALEFVNSATWSEGTKIEDSRFINCTEGIVFRTPTGNATGSYASTQINRCYFNLPDNALGIMVEQRAELSDSQVQNVRMWMGENGFVHNQTGLVVDGSMHQSLLFGVVFESFANYPEEIYAISLGATSITPPILAGGISFLGNMTARIHNPYNKWIGGAGAVFRQQNLKVPLGMNGQYASPLEIQMRPLTVTSFKPQIQVQGSFADNETVTVRFRLEFVDNTISPSVVRTFTNSTTTWLSDSEIIRLLPSQSIIWSILVDAKADSASTDATVQVSIYGTVT